MPKPTFLFALIASLIAGCATDRDIKQFVRAEKRPPRILLSEAPMSADRSKLDAVFARNEDTKEQIALVQSRALDWMGAALTGKQGTVFFTAGTLVPDKPLSQPDADAISQATGADALLRFRITDYGLMPKSWRDGYVAFEVTSTLAIAGIIAYTGTTAAHAAAGGYLAQETIEETTEAYAGLWGLDVVCRPVRLEAELVKLQPLKTIWTTEETGFSDIRLSRLTRTVAASERNSQLDQSTHRAIDDVAADLLKAVSRRTLP